jgi:glucose-6-phosphate isomerase/transaldolase/glucose-6-phosphate isomerase
MIDDANLIFSLGAAEKEVLQALKDLQRDQIAERIALRDYTVWKSTPDEIINRLGWLDAPADSLKQLSYIHTVIDPLIHEGYKKVILLGMGGSCLAAEVFSRILGKRNGYPDMDILDTTDPVVISRISQKLNWSQTLFLVSSKSGTTLETVSLFHYFYNAALQKLGRQAHRNFIFITDPDSPMEELAYRLSLRHVFLNNPAIGGRYSALSLPGIVPAVLMGIDAEFLLRKALTTAQKETAAYSAGGFNSNGIVLGAALGTLAKSGRNKLIIFCPPRWQSFGNWLEQLLAESTGKEGKGILPICSAPSEETNIYGDDRLFAIFADKKDPQDKTYSALIAAGHPVIKLQLINDYDLGSQMFCWEMATAVACHILGVNPFNQPDVEMTKTLTRKMIELYREKKELPEEKPALADAGCSVYSCAMSPSPAAALKEFLTGAAEDSYVCLQVYLSPEAGLEDALRQLLKTISSKYGLAATIGYGPRYLHSTGQLHKGDAGKGLFIQLTADDREDLAIPDQIGDTRSTLTFGTLKSAQAMGDRQALIALGRKIIRFHFGTDITGQIKALTNYLQ